MSSIDLWLPAFLISLLAGIVGYCLTQRLNDSSCMWRLREARISDEGVIIPITDSIRLSGNMTPDGTLFLRAVDNTGTNITPAALAHVVQALRPAARSPPRVSRSTAILPGDIVAGSSSA